MQALYAELRVDASRPVQDKQFFGSTTAMLPDSLGPADTRRVLAELGIDPASLQRSPRDSTQGDRIEILRHTLMNPFVRDEENGIDYIDRYFEYLEMLVRRLAGAFAPLVSAQRPDHLSARSTVTLTSCATTDSSAQSPPPMP
jgi:hypothetical protein